ncbi:MAG: valine--tRNA ligase [Gammaproteobacteria bacterium]|nr:valine--tRNA ligase [Gammaproteobacteria bacterium]
MDKTYDPQAIERRWYDNWERHGYFAPRETGGKPYCILLPPPNVTGTLHMGHAFQQTLMDTLIRYHRMRGECVLWQGGTDHAGIATQKIVENQLAAEDQTRHDLGRERFIKRVWQWKDESGSVITKQMRRLGASIDWSRERFTMDAGLSAAVRRVFIDWYRAGLLYRGKRLVHWDPVLQTAVSDLEVNNEERDGHLWLIRYPASDGGEGLVVATTRPETLLGDVAVAVHPQDKRYKKLIGKKLRLPLAEREIPVIGDEYVDKEFGTGAVKITPAHDFNDYKIGQRHRLPLLTIFTLDAKVNNAAPAAYRGLERFAARKRIIADITHQQLLIETRKHKLMVPVSQRSDAIIEPMLTDQWFLDLTSDVRVDGQPGAGGRKAITEPALKAVRSGDIKFVPDNWSTTYTQWLENIQDWCVSRQLWWGHRIPAWYDEAGNIFVGDDETDAVKHGAAKPVGQLRQDEDVLDTWFSSALWPFSTLGWPSADPVKNMSGGTVANWSKDQRFLPSAVLVTGFDIIFFWVARMVMATQYFTRRVPFREVYINAIVRDSEGQKMSKSKGNTIDPLDLMDGIGLEALVKKSTESLLIPQVREKVAKRIRHEYPDGIPAVGADALRFTFAALATYSRTINFDLKRCEGYRNFCTKLWNASRFVLMNCEGFTAKGLPPLRTLAEHWIVNKLEHLLHNIDEHYKTYRFDLLAQELYEFTWNDYCDWFIELSKPALNGTDRQAADSTRHTLLYVLEALLRALHPISPFITEELWQQIAPKLGIKGASVSMQDYPKIQRQISNPSKATGDIVSLIYAVGEIRKIRSEHGVPPSKSMRVVLEAGVHDPYLFDRIGAELAFLARIESITRLEPGASPPRAAVAITIDDARLHIPFEGLIDVAAELERLEKQLTRLRAELQRLEAKLGNQAFVGKAPAELVDKERNRAAETANAIRELESQIANISRLG